MKHDSRCVAVGGRVGHREDRDEVGHRTLADEPLRAGQQVVVAVADRLGADGGHVRARLRLGQGERDELLPGRQPRDPAGLLLGGPAEEQRQRAELLDGEDEPGRGAGATELLDRQAQAEELAPEPTVLHRERQGQDVLGSQQLAQVLRELAGPVDLGGAWGDPFVGDDADGVAEEGLLLGQSIGGRRRLGHHRHPSSGGLAKGRRCRAAQ